VTIAAPADIDDIARSPSPGICVCDASTNEDLLTIGPALARAGRLSCLAGPAGLAELLPDLLGLSDDAHRPVRPSAGRSKLLVVNGSLTETALGQVAYALESGFAPIHVPPEIVLAHEPPFPGGLEGSVRNARADDAVIYTAVNSRHAETYIAHGHTAGLAEEATLARIPHNLGVLASRTAAALGRTLLASFGGETSRALLAALACRGLRPLDELGPGLVVSEIVEGRLTGHLVTKSGGFGGRDVVDTIRNYFTEGQDSGTGNNDG
jgi:uncharacterized protein YgbK (DUF1537 family)